MQTQSIELTPEEIGVLKEVLQHQLQDMEVEVGRTDTSSFKQMLKHRRDILENALHKLEHQPVHS